MSHLVTLAHGKRLATAPSVMVTAHLGLVISDVATLAEGMGLASAPSVIVTAHVASGMCIPAIVLTDQSSSCSRCRQGSTTRNRAGTR